MDDRLDEVSTAIEGTILSVKVDSFFSALTSLSVRDAGSSWTSNDSVIPSLGRCGFCPEGLYST